MAWGVRPGRLVCCCRRVLRFDSDAQSSVKLKGKLFYFYISFFTLFCCLGLERARPRLVGPRFTRGNWPRFCRKRNGRKIQSAIWWTVKNRVLFAFTARWRALTLACAIKGKAHSNYRTEEIIFLQIFRHRLSVWNWSENSLSLTFFFSYHFRYHLFGVNESAPSRSAAQCGAHQRVLRDF